MISDKLFLLISVIALPIALTGLLLALKGVLLMRKIIGGQIEVLCVRHPEDASASEGKEE